jgi:hypothetical protein
MTTENPNAIGVTAVAVTRKNDDGELYLDWLLEGGISELEFAGQVLLTMPEANDICDENGSAYLHRTPQPSQGVRGLVEALKSIYDEDFQAGHDATDSEISDSKKRCIYRIRKIAQEALRAHRAQQGEQP